MSLDQGSQRCEHASIFLVWVLVEASDTLHDQITHSDFGHPDCKKTLDQRDEARVQQLQILNPSVRHHAMTLIPTCVLESRF